MFLRCHLEAIILYPKSAADVARSSTYINIVYTMDHHDRFSIRFKNCKISADVTNSKGHSNMYI